MGSVHPDVVRLRGLLPGDLRTDLGRAYAPGWYPQARALVERVGEDEFIISFYDADVSDYAQRLSIPTHWTTPSAVTSE